MITAWAQAVLAKLNNVIILRIFTKCLYSTGRSTLYCRHCLLVCLDNSKRHMMRYDAIRISKEE